MQSNMEPFVYAALFKICTQRSTVLLELFFFFFFSFPEDPLTLREAKYVLLHFTSPLTPPHFYLSRGRFSLCACFFLNRKRSTGLPRADTHTNTFMCTAMLVISFGNSNLEILHDRR